jgi:hypothetical protein
MLCLVLIYHSWILAERFFFVIKNKIPVLGRTSIVTISIGSNVISIEITRVTVGIVGVTTESGTNWLSVSYFNLIV